MIAVWLARGRTQVNGASVAVFRVGYGLAGLILVIRFFAHGWIESLFLRPEFHFKYAGFGWVQPWPTWGMYAQFVIMGLAAVSVALGFRHRLGAGVFALGLAYVELVDRSLYLNHYYWMILSGMLFVFLPMGARWSVDSALGRRSPTMQVSLWVVRLLRFQVGMVYVFAGLAKINGDWMFRAEPLSTWLPARADFWAIGPLLVMPATAFALSWAGAAFDLTIVAWLSVRRTRAVAFVVLVGFHLLTWLLFPSIGVFPLLMTLGATIFFDPDWPDRFRTAHAAPRSERMVAPRRRLVGVLAAVYVVAMSLLPLRHHVMPGDVTWTGQGYLGSWQVMLAEKSGSARFIVTDDAGRSWALPPPAYLTERQAAMMATSPDLIRQVAAAIAEDLGVSVAADVRLSVNGGPSVQFTDPDSAVIGAPISTWVVDQGNLRS